MDKKNKKRKEKINEEITSKNIRIVGKNIESRIVPLHEALRIAEDKELDLIEISIQQDNLSICKIDNYNKYIYEKKRKDKEQLKNSKKIKIKEIRLTPTTGEHDFNFKLNHAKNFLEEKDKVKLTMNFSGRELNFKEIGEILMLKFVNELTDIGKAESLPKTEGKRMWMIVAPKVDKIN